MIDEQLILYYSFYMMPRRKKVDSSRFSTLDGGFLSISAAGEAAFFY